MKWWYATPPPATRNRKIQWSLNKNLDEVPVAPENDGLHMFFRVDVNLCKAGYMFPNIAWSTSWSSSSATTTTTTTTRRRRRRRRTPTQPPRRPASFKKPHPTWKTTTKHDWQLQLRDCSNISSTKVDWRHHAEAPLVSWDFSRVFVKLRDPYIVSECLLWENPAPVEKVKHIKNR